MRMSLALVVATLALTVPVKPRAQSEGDGLEKPGDCTKADYRRLNAAVGTACKAVPLRCEAHMECAGLVENWKRFAACIQARTALMDQCFRGGNEAHRKKLNETSQGQQRCVNFIRLKCSSGKGEGEGCSG